MTTHLEPTTTSTESIATPRPLFPHPVEWSHRPALDGTRALAVYLVLAFHAGVTAFEGGFIGVDVFFVLSGYLMTNVLLAEADRTGTIRLRRFYARRARRLLPAAVVTIIATAALLLLVVPLAERLRLIDDAQASLLYVANWEYVLSATDYFASEDAASPFLHFWSLSLEEQYYVFFPLLLIGMLAVARRLGRVTILPIVLGGLALASVGAQLYWQSRDPIRAYYGTDARLYQILAGAVLATVFVLRPHLRRDRGFHGLMAAASVVGLVFLSTSIVGLDPSGRGFLATAGSLLLIAGLEGDDRSPAGSVLQLPSLTYLGAISYGTYLWHWPVIVVLRRLLELEPWVLLALVVPLSTGLAALSYQLLETPIRRSRRLDPRPLLMALGGLAISVIAAFVIVPPILQSEARPQTTSEAATFAGVGDLGSEPVPTGIDYRALAGDRPPFPTCGVDDPEQCTIVDGAGAHVLLVGDSHARMMIPTFQRAAEDNGLTFSVNVTPSCTWQIGLQNTLRPIEERARCEASRAAWYRDTLPQLDPDVVVFVSLARDGEGATPGQMVPDDETLQDLTLPEMIEVLSARTVELVAAEGRRIVIVEPVPRASFNVLDCLSGARVVIDCAFAVDPGPPSEQIYRDLAAAEQTVTTVDLDRLLCPDHPICLPIIDDIVVRRDGSHITSAFAESLADPVWAAIDQSQ
ncbi:MAG: acyltransferase family protein [Actinomycetota bacterium]